MPCHRLLPRRRPFIFLNQRHSLPRARVSSLCEEEEEEEEDDVPPRACDVYRSYVY
jgi:hypothetical protein